MSHFEHIVMYIGFVLWFIAGISTGRRWEKNKKFKERTKNLEGESN